MANGLPDSLYTGGAVVFDSRPSTNLYAQLMARKQAREEALDEYERRRLDRMNESGLRDQDREGLDNMVLDLKTYYNANKDAVRKGNNAAAYEYEKKFRDALGYISESKERTAKSQAFEKWRQERLKQGRMIPEGAFEEYVMHEKPIRTEGSQTFDLPKYLSQSAPKYDQAKTLKLFSDIKRTPGEPKYEAIPGEQFKKREIIEERFDDAAKETIVARASELYDSDDGFAFEVQEDFNNPVKRGQLEKVFAEEFKTQPQSLRDYAVAKKMQELQPSIVKSKTIEDWKAKADYMQKNKERNIALNRSGVGGGGVARGNAFDDLADADFKNFRIKSGLFYDNDGNLKSGAVFITGNVIPASVRSALNAGGIDDKYLTGGVNAVVKDGKIQSISNKLIGTVTRGMMEGVYQRKLDTEPLKGQKLEFDKDGKPKPPSNKMVTVILKDGRKGQIPENTLQQFLKDNPGAKKQ